jgi:gluconate 2-dehydrogenase gamma chain
MLKGEEVMGEHNEARRSFLIKSALGVGAVAGAALPIATEAEAATNASGMATTPAATNMPVAARSTTTDAKWRAFFSEEEAYAVSAIAERIMPGVVGMAGATDADVINYIDLALSGAYADQQEFYRRGLAALDIHCEATYKDAFIFLNASLQDEALTALDAGKATGFTWPTSQAFFNVLRTHTMEGMFADPVYGGNRDFAGWKLVGFPGAQRLYTPADLKSNDAFRGPIVGLQAMAETLNGRK